MQIIKEGAGAGYTVTADIEFAHIQDIKILNIKLEDDHSDIEFSCVAQGLADNITAENYEYSVHLDDPVDCEMTGGKISIPGTGLHKNILASLIYEELLDSHIETKCHLGSGYIHVNYEGTLAEMDSDDIDSYESYNSSLFAADIYITDAKVINYIDSGLEGENEIHSYSIPDFDEDFDSFDAAYAFAKQNNATQIIDTTFELKIDGDIVFVGDAVLNLEPDFEYIDEGFSYTDIDLIDALWPKEQMSEFVYELEDKIKELSKDNTVELDEFYIDDNMVLHIIFNTENSSFEETIKLDSRKYKNVYDLISKCLDNMAKIFADRIKSDNELWNSTNEGEFNLTENVIESATTFYNTYNMTIEEAVKKAVDICNEVHSEDVSDISYDNILEAVKNTLDESRDKPWGEMAYNLNEIISAMNNEEAYYGSWLYTWVDESTLDDAIEYFPDEESYNDLLELFKDTYIEYHEDGLYTSSRRIINMAHTWDKKLGLDEIEVFTPNRI